MSTLTYATSSALYGGEDRDCISRPVSSAALAASEAELLAPAVLSANGAESVAGAAATGEPAVSATLAALDTLRFSMADARASVEGVAPVLLGAGAAPARSDGSSGSGVRGEPLISKAVGNGCEERFVVLFQEEILDRDINPFQVAETEDLVDQPSPPPQKERTISDRWVDQAVVPSK